MPTETDVRRDPWTGIPWRWVGDEGTLVVLTAEPIPEPDTQIALLPASPSPHRKVSADFWNEWTRA